jgi:hypothetical protein
VRFTQDGERLWEQWQANNPPPWHKDSGEPFTYDPRTWPGDVVVRFPVEDLYGVAIVYAAGQWADAMDEVIDQHGHQDFKDVAVPTFEALNQSLGQWELNAVQYSACVAVLSHTWEHGEQLRRWHNLSVQVGTEGEEANESGGILNAGVILEEPT